MSRQATKLQAKAVRYGLKHSHCLIPMPIGEGKTGVGLILAGKIGEPTVVFSTKQIIEETWGPEIEAWGFPYSYAAATGSEVNREAAVAAKPFILGVSFDHMRWYLEQAHDLVERTTCIIDETSKLKAEPSKSKRVKAMMKGTERFTHCYGLSATPAPEGAMGLWPQFACITKDRPLGRLGEFRDRYFDAVKRPTHTEYHIREGTLKEIGAALKGYYFPAPPKQKARFGLPAPREIEVQVPWPAGGEDNYRQMQKELAIFHGEPEDGDVIASADSPGILQHKLRQLASGFVYDEDDVIRMIGYDDKVNELERLIDRVGDVPILCFTQYEEEDNQIRAAFPEAVFGLSEGVKRRWNNREIPLLVLNPKSAAHGLNLQDGSNIVLFYSLPWSGEEYDQSVGRLYRRGQTHQVTVIRFSRVGTIEGRMFRRICEKREFEYEIMEALSGRAA